MTDHKFVDIIETKTGKITKRFDVTGKSERVIEKLIRGILRNLDTENFTVGESQ